jgi:uncharacterized delta-60 repeat protein
MVTAQFRITSRKEIVMNRDRANRHVATCFEPLEDRRMFAAGDLDPTFGVGGKVISETVGYPVADIAVQPDGKYIVVGSLNGDFAVTRFNANGTPDRTFGGNGFVRTNFGGKGGDFANAVAVQPDGKIVVVGRRGESLRDGSHFAIARYNPNGTPDSTFDGDGKLTVDFGGGSSANAVTFSGREILVAGSADTGIVNINDDFAVVKLRHNGSLDSNFGKGRLLGGRSGKMTIDFGSDTQSEGATAIAVDTDGKVVLGGLGGNGLVARSQKFAVARLNHDGTIDSSFGDGISGKGKFNNLLHFSEFRDLHVAADRSITAVGGVNGNFLTVRLTSLGRLDKSFGGTGHIITDMGGNDDAKHIRVNREGIIIAGVSSGKFAMLRYRLNGQLDTRFGKAGKVVTAVGANDAILTSVQAPDGKLLAYGRRGVARYIQSMPIVEVLNQDTDASEAKDQPGSILIKRDRAYEFSTRVFLDISSPATLNVDYTSPQLQRAPNFSVPSAGGSGSLVPVQFLGFRHFVDIPAGKSSVTAQINVKKDNELDPAEVVRWAPIADPSYQLGAGNAGHVTIQDNTTLRVNFQVKASPFAFAYEPDLGLPFGARPNGQQFGWDVDNRANARDRGTASAPGMSLIYQTFNHMQKPGGARTWEFALPKGMYQVKLAAGDPSDTASVHKMNLEGQLALSGTPSGRVRWFERTVNVQVNDGRLTLSNASGAVNNKIAFIEIKTAAPGATAGPVTDNLPVSLPPVTPGKLPTGGAITRLVANNGREQTIGLFSDKQIDETLGL